MHAKINAEPCAQSEMKWKSKIYWWGEVDRAGSPKLCAEGLHMCHIQHKAEDH